MTYPSSIRGLGAGLALVLMLPLAACGENPPADAPTTTPLPNVSEDRLIDGVVPSDQVETETDTTPQTSSGGGIPGHSPAAGEGANGNQPATSGAEPDSTGQPVSPPAQ